MPSLQSRTAGTLLEEPSSRKRSYHHFFHSDARTETLSPSPPRLRLSTTPSSSEPTIMSRPTQFPHQRFVGDGFDYRRPVMSTSTRPRTTGPSSPAPDVIDLTSDPAPPLTRPTPRRTSVERRIPRAVQQGRGHSGRSSHNREMSRPVATSQRSRGPVIDLESPNVGSPARTPSLLPEGSLVIADDDFTSLFQQSPSSPGFEITGERPVQANIARRSVAERRPTPYVTGDHREPSEALPPPPPQSLFENLPNGLANWIAQTGSSFMETLRPAQVEHSGLQNAAGSNQALQGDGVHVPVAEYQPGHGWRPPSRIQLPRLAALDFHRPRLNYEAQGFELVATTRTSPPPRPQSPYKGPGAATAGFVRQVAGEDVAVCAHCGDELRTGNNELKQQIWVVKQCGHVYCGDCTTNRNVRKGKKGTFPVEGHPGPFRNCVVPGCKKSVVSKTALFQVYL